MTTTVTCFHSQGAWCSLFATTRLCTQTHKEPQSFGRTPGQWKQDKIKMILYLFQTNTGWCCRVEVKSKLIDQCVSVRCVDCHSEFRLGSAQNIKLWNLELKVSVNQWFSAILNSHWIEHNIDLPIAGLPGTSALCDALVHVLLLVKIDHLWIETMHKITQNWNYQIETETCSRQSRLVYFSTSTISKLAVERETVSIRGTGKVLKVPVESTFL